MKQIYKQILEKALPYYEKGREGDIEHIKWLSKTVVKFIDKTIDPDILMHLVILHDVGYANVPKDSDSYNLNIRKLHSEESAKIAEKILEELKYLKEKILEIKRLILKHDNWAFGDSFADEPLLLLFQNFDFIWLASKERFEIYRKNNQGFIEFNKQIEKFQEDNIKRGIKWYNKKVENYYRQLMEEQKEELK